MVRVTVTAQWPVTATATTSRISVTTNKIQIVSCNNQSAAQQTQQQQHVGYSTVSGGSDLNSKTKTFSNELEAALSSTIAQRPLYNKNCLKATINHWQQPTIADKATTATGHKRSGNNQSVATKSATATSSDKKGNNQPAVTKRTTFTAQWPQQHFPKISRGNNQPAATSNQQC